MLYPVSRQSAIAGYAIVIVAVLAALGLRQLLAPVLHAHAPYVTFYIAASNSSPGS